MIIIYNQNMFIVQATSDSVIASHFCPRPRFCGKVKNIIFGPEKILAGQFQHFLQSSYNRSQVKG
jgi:hypothetical protein